MKKILLFITMFILSITNVNALKVEVEDINISDHSDTIALGEYSIKGNKFSPDITFNKVNDYVTYEIKFKNNDKYTIKSITDDNPNEIMKTSYSYDKDLSKPIYITLTYITKTDELPPENICTTITLVDKNGKEEILEIGIDKSNEIIKEGPGTGIVISLTLSLVSILLVGYLYFAYYRNKKNIETMILIIGLLLIPVSIVVADSKVSLIIDKSNIKIYNSPWEIVTQTTPGTLSVGDELAVDTEHFYVVSSNEDKTVLLAKYNLYVGDIFDVDNGQYFLNKTIQKTDEGYGLQNETAKGWKYDVPDYQCVGVIKFSETNYWVDEEWKLLPKYRTGIEDNDNEFWHWKNNYIYDNNSILYQYIENYTQYLKNLGLSNIKGRLLAYNEYESLEDRETEKIYNLLHDTAYWLGSAYTGSIPWTIDSVGVPEMGEYNTTNLFGVRPVIEVNTNDIGI